MFSWRVIGVIVSLIIFSKKKGVKFLRLMDAVALSMPIGLGLVRIGNFLNGSYGANQQIKTGDSFFQMILLVMPDTPHNYMKALAKA